MTFLTCEENLKIGEITSQFVCTDYQNVLNTAFFQLIKYSKPIFGTLIFADMYGKNFLVSRKRYCENYIRCKLFLPARCHAQKMCCVYENDWINIVKWTILPFFYLWQKPVCNV